MNDRSRGRSPDIDEIDYGTFRDCQSHGSEDQGVQVQANLDIGGQAVQVAGEQGNPILANPDAEDQTKLRNSALLEELKTICKDTAEALAADRATKFLPVIIAQSLFIGSIAVAFIKTSTGVPGPSNWINVEAHSIAFTAPYLWIIPTVLFSSVIGVSQTELAMPHILAQFQDKMSKLVAKDEALEELRPFELKLTTESRARNGGIYSWRPEQWCKLHECITYRRSIRGKTPDMGKKVILAIASVAIVFLGTLAACIISDRVPPVGRDCRQYAQGGIFLLWFISYGMGFLPKLFPKLRSHVPHFWFVFAKDLIIASLMILGILITQAGVFNRCSCLTKFGETGLQLPQQSEVLELLSYRIKVDYVLLAFGCVVLQLMVFIGAWVFFFKGAFTVYLQRDDEKSNSDPYDRLKARFSNVVLRRRGPPWCYRQLTFVEDARGLELQQSQVPLLTQANEENPQAQRQSSVGEPVLRAPDQARSRSREPSRRHGYPRQLSVDLGNRMFRD